MPAVILWVLSGFYSRHPAIIESPIQRTNKIAHPPDKKRRLEKRERKRRQAPDNEQNARDGSVDLRQKERHDSHQAESQVGYIPLDSNECDNELDGNKPTAAGAAEPCDISEPPLITNKVTPQSTNEWNDQPATDTNNKMDEPPSKKNLTPAEQDRLSALKSMLDASNARYEQATRNRRPVFAAGLEVKVVRGDYAGKVGVVLDADYIENRALISLADQDSPRWIGFRSLGHAD